MYGYDFTMLGVSYAKPTSEPLKHYAPRLIKLVRVSISEFWLSLSDTGPARGRLCVERSTRAALILHDIVTIRMRDGE